MLLTRLFRPKSEKIESNPRVSSQDLGIVRALVVGDDRFFSPLVLRDLLWQSEKEFAALRRRRTLCPREQKVSPDNRSRNVFGEDSEFGQ